MEAVASPCTFSPPVANIISVDEFLDMSNSPEYADCRFELVDAKVNEMSHPNYLHGFVLTELGSILRSHVKVQGHGTVIISEIGFVLGALSCLASRSKSPTSFPRKHADFSTQWALMPMEIFDRIAVSAEEI